MNQNSSGAIEYDTDQGSQGTYEASADSAAFATSGSSEFASSESTRNCGAVVNWTKLRPRSDMVNVSRACSTSHATILRLRACICDKLTALSPGNFS